MTQGVRWNRWATTSRRSAAARGQVGKSGGIPKSSARAQAVRYAYAIRSNLDPWRARPPKAGRIAGHLPDYPTSAEELFRRYEKHGLTSEQVWSVAKKTLLEDTRFADNISPYLRVVRNYPSSDEALRHWEELPKAQRQRLQKHLADDMVGLTHRAPQVLRVGDNGDDVSVLFEQHFGHVCENPGTCNTGLWSLRDGYTLSSEVAKKDDRPINGHSLQHCANSAWIAADKTLIAWRSARCDTPRKLEGNLVGSCCASLAAAGGDKAQARGFRQAANGTWEYQPVLVTAMDKSFVKHLFELIRSLFGGEKRTERARLQALNAACRNVFPDDQNTGRYYNIEIAGNVERVFIRRPQVVNVVLSSQANRAGAVREARGDNRESAYGLGRLLAETLQRSGSAADAAVVQSFLETPQEHMQAKLRDEEYGAYVAQMRPSLRLSLEWLHLLLAKSTLDGNELTRPSDPATETLLLKNLLDEANIAASVGCKSGVDRTPVVCSLFSAAHAFAATNGTAFDPLTGSESDVAAMRSSFTRFASILAKPVVDLTRGENAPIKWNGQPIAKHWYIPAEGTLVPLSKPPAS